MVGFAIDRARIIFRAAGIETWVPAFVEVLGLLDQFLFGQLEAAGFTTTGFFLRPLGFPLLMFSVVLEGHAPTVPDRGCRKRRTASGLGKTRGRYDHRMRRSSPLGIIVTVAVPAVLLGNALLILLVPWMADVQYAIPGFPDDPLGLTGEDRSDLAETGIRSIWPIGQGTELLEEATLPDGEAAFQAKEILHMDDVRHLVRTILAIWLVALVAGAVALHALFRRAGRAPSLTALGRGARLTLILMAVVGLFMLVSFEFFFDGFHAIFFEGDTWKFADFYTLRRIYPDAFWGIASAFFAILVLAQALLLARFTTGLPWPRRRGEAQDIQ